MNKENYFYLFLALIAIVVLVFVNADKLWDKVDNKVMPLVSNQEDEYVATPGAGSADPKWITNIYIDWDKGNVNISYAPQQRITWKETFTEGGPLQYNVLYYMMNTHTLSIHYYTQEYYDMDKHPDLHISKDLQVTIPRGVVLEELVVRVASGEVKCEVEANKKVLK